VSSFRSQLPRSIGSQPQLQTPHLPPVLLKWASKAPPHRLLDRLQGRIQAVMVERAVASLIRYSSWTLSTALNALLLWSTRRKQSSALRCFADSEQGIRV
jgi:hypothetical protein